MRRQPRFWTSLFAKLGLSRKKRHSSNSSAFNRRLRFEQCEDRKMLATYTVNVAYDANTFSDQDSIVTLREAVFRANQEDDADTIVFAPGLSGTPITLGKDANGNNLNLGSQGQLNITESVTIKGEDLSGNPLDITIDASGNDPTPDSTHTDGNGLNDQDGSTVFYMSGYGGSFDVTLQNLTITGGGSHVPAKEFMAVFALAA